MLYLNNICKTFQQTQVLQHFSCKMNPGDFVILMGPNGTGKTTLFDIISGKTLPEQGSIYLGDLDLGSLSEQKRALYVSRLFQNPALGCCLSLTVRENLAMAMLKGQSARLKTGIKAFPEKIVSDFNLNISHLLDVPMQALSGGQRQLISFVMSILKPPKVLLLDEPTAALDPASATELLSVVKTYALQHQMIVLLITHDPVIAKHLGNRLLILEKGSIQKDLGPEKQYMNPHDFFCPIDYGKLEKA